ncbi:MAG: VCBS repeat-containing protein [Planctomycetales bacterium]|nr:VCBS repeat-containing protein [Planctomycetales bacterium]
MHNRLEHLETRRCLSVDVSFIGHELTCCLELRPQQVGTADMNGDSLVDVLVLADGKVFVHLNDGRGGFHKSPTSDARSGILSHVVRFNVADLDADGDLDLLVDRTFEGFADEGNSTEWLENIDGRGVFSSPWEVVDVYDPNSRSIPTDVDGDGDIDIVWATSSQSQIWWIENHGEGTFQFADRISIPGEWIAPNGFGIDVGDIDNDGDSDIISRRTPTSDVVLYTNQGVEGFTRDIVFSHHEDNAIGLTSLMYFDDDDVLDIVIRSIGQDRISWSKGHVIEGFSTPVPIVFGDVARSEFADIDNDGDVDVLAMVSDETNTNANMYENTGGAERFPLKSSNLLSNGHPTTIGKIVDLDGDGAADALTYDYTSHAVGWYRNVDTTTFSLSAWQPISSAIRDASVVDVDGDGDADIAAVSYGQIVYFENLGRSFATERPLANGNFNTVDAADIDGDGDEDLVTTEYYNNQDSIWLENKGGEFVSRPLVSGYSFRQIDLIDINGDGRADFIGRVNTAPDNVRSRVNTVSTFIATDLGFRFDQTIANERIRYDHIVADLDSDGDNDLVLWQATTRQFVIYENTDSGLTVSRSLGVFNDVRSIAAIDIDDDSVLDLVIATKGALSWFKNNGDFGFTGEPSTLIELDPSTNEVKELMTRDIDRDGDLDLLANGVMWIREKDGEFTIQNVMKASIGLGSSFDVFDFDSDGDLDVLNWQQSEGNWMYLFESRPIGDSNNDGVFDSSDLVKVFQSAKYDDGVPMNATFDEGDWNGDGDFDSSDLVFAFQTQSYVRTRG